MIGVNKQTLKSTYRVGDAKSARIIHNALYRHTMGRDAHHSIGANPSPCIPVKKCVIVRF